MIRLRVYALQATSCDQDACSSAFPSQCPASGESGSTQATSISATTYAYTTAPGAIALDNSSVTDACQPYDVTQCGESYSVAVSGSTLTLTPTSGTAGYSCATGTGKCFHCYFALSVVAIACGAFVSRIAQHREQE